ncbi:RNA binding protein [Arthrobacter phage DrManhattan]|uniref:RNA binding protein n=2 Tax=Manhattanvirus drmanhattan TaxID=2734250 RepID=A0A3G2KFR2_9CAUD|nr:hypothetical protein HOU48_gp55 [Arthrobacter phage DrManhattan]AYN57775.1 RNA binding protein [Arthrobacter phage DrManhattan]QHB36638.1 RNA binding protein [Arthrobacter phage Adolin]
MTPEARLTAARNAGKPVTVVLDDGRVLSGVPLHTLTAQFKIQSPGASRPVYFLSADVISVTPA